MQLIKILVKVLWKIGYGSETIDDHYLDANDKATQEDIDKQFYDDLKCFSKEAEKYIFVNLNKNKRAALLSFAHSIGICSFKSCRLLDLINSYGSKNKIIKEWSPLYKSHMDVRRRSNDR